jgi:stress response protein SCP2
MIHCFDVAATADCAAGDAKGDDESVVVNLQDLSSEVDALIFTVHAFSGTHSKHSCLVQRCTVTACTMLLLNTC